MDETKTVSNAKRFLTAYNNIDYALKTRYNLNRAMGFSDLIRKAVPVNYVVRKYEDELIDYGRLRNAIIHNSNEDFVIAEPHDSVVEKIEHIEKLLTTPPLALESVAQKDVIVVNAGKSMREVILLISSSGYSNIPVYRDNKLLGVANGQKILHSFGQYLLSGGNEGTFLDNVQIEDMLSSIENNNYYCVKKADCTIEEALSEFNNNHKLLAILFTKNGLSTELPLGIMTGANVVEAQKILENY
jgi:predicted transcriptional regulator